MAILLMTKAYFLAAFCKLGFGKSKNKIILHTRPDNSEGKRAGKAGVKAKRNIIEVILRNKNIGKSHETKDPIFTCIVSG